MLEGSIGILGASSFVGECSIQNLVQNGCKITAFSRKNIASRDCDPVQWLQLSPEKMQPTNSMPINDWISLAPIWVLPDYLPLFESYDAKRVIALSSTSVFTKADSSDSGERALIKRLVAAERRFTEWAEHKGVDWVILRPTMIYGKNKDKNISEIALLIAKFGFFPIFGKAKGLRQPIHVEDVANACRSVLVNTQLKNKAYNISGGEILAYSVLVERIFYALHRRPRILVIPISLFKCVVAVLHLFPRYRHWSTAMVERMNRDMIFSHEQAAQDFNFQPRAFVLADEDVNYHSGTDQKSA